MEIYHWEMLKLKRLKLKKSQPKKDKIFANFSLNNQDFIMTYLKDRIFIKNCNNFKVYELINEVK